MKALLDFIVDILKVPSVLVGIIALIGLIAQKKPVADIIKGTIKTILGFIVLGGGAGVLLGSLNPLGDIFQQAFNVQGVVPNNEAIVSTALEKYGTATALIMAFGMVANIARFTRLKFIFLTGHHTFYMACMIAVILVVAGFEGAHLVLVGSLSLGLVMAFFPFIAQPFMRDITGSDEVGFGHFGTVGYVLAGSVGRALRPMKSRSTEEMNLPKNLGFLRDSSVSIALTMMVIYLVLVIAAGQEFVQQKAFSNGQNYLVWAVIQAITFAAGVFIILQGVRLILAEIVPAFTGFSQKLVPNARPALDCPIVFPYAPNAVLVGFLASFVGGLIGLFILGKLNWVLILPGVVPHFFCGATAGVFGNAVGGRLGAVVGAFLHGILITFLPVWLLPVLGDLGFANTTFSDADFGVVGIALGWLGNHAGRFAITALVIGIVAALVAYNYAVPAKAKAADKK